MRAIHRVASVLAFAVYTLLFVEVFIRIFDPQTIEPRYITGAPWGVRHNIPGAIYVHTTPESTAHFSINQQGMRDPRNFAFAKPPGLCRVEVYGDSFFMGYEVEREQGYAAQLEQKLKERGYTVEVLNLSVSGFGQAEMLKTYEAFGRRFGPDLVVVSWHDTDVDDNVRAQLYKVQGKNLVAYKPTYLPMVSTQDWLSRHWLYTEIADHSHAYAFFREALGARAKTLLASVRKQEAAGPEDTEAAAEAPSTRKPEQAALELSEAIWNKFQDEVMADQAQMVVVEIPKRIDRSTYVSMLAKLPPTFWGHFNVVSPLAEFQRMAAGRPEIYYEKGGARHFTPLGNSVAASLTADEIARSGQLSRCREPRVAQQDRHPRP